MPQKKVSATIQVTAVIDGQDGQPGAEGNGIQSVSRTYAVSSQATTASDTTPPSDITTWAAASPATTVEKPYLWAKEVVTYTKAAATTKYYMIGARGQNGIDAQDFEWAYIRTKTNTAPIIATDSSYTDSKGKTYTADDHLPHVTGNANIESDNSGVSGKTYECTDDPKGVNDEWPYEWEIKREKGANDANGHRDWTAYSGTMTLHNNLAASLLSIDIDNDSDQFGVDADGKVLAQQARSTVVSMAYGTALQQFTAAPTASLRYDDGTTVPTSVATAAVDVVANTDNTQYRVTVTVKATDTNTPVFGTSGKNGLYVDISGTCARGTKSIRFSLAKVMGGASGENPVIWQLNPSRKSFVFGRDASNNLTPASVASSIYVTRTDGNTTTEHTSASGLTNPPTFSWGFDSSSTAQASGRAIGTAISISNTQAASHSSVWVKLSTGDRETLPILKDGAKGEDGATVGINLLDGTNLAINIDKWNVFNGAVQSDGAMGQKSIFNDNSSSSEYADVLQQEVFSATMARVMPSTWYTLSYWVKGSGSVASFVYASCVDTSAGCYKDGVLSTFVSDDGNMTVTPTSTWTRHTYTFKTKATLTGTQQVLFRVLAGAVAAFSAIKLEAGTTATDWCLSEDDKRGRNGDTPMQAFQWNQSADTAPTPLPDGATLDPWSAVAPNRPGNGYYLWMTQTTKHTATDGTVRYDAWSPAVCISGADGTPGEDAPDKEWIYRLTTGTAPSLPTSNEQDKNKDGYVPQGWTNHPTGVDSTNVSEYACYRTKQAGIGERKWSEWKGKTGGQLGDAPILWSHYGRNGIDGDGTEYVFIRTKNNVAPIIITTASDKDSQNRTYKDDEYLPQVYGNVQGGGNRTDIEVNGGTESYPECTDDPQGTSSTWKYEWVAKRTKDEAAADGSRSWKNYTTGHEMSRFSNWAEDGEDGAPGTMYQRKYRSLDVGIWPSGVTIPTTEDNPKDWFDTPTHIQVGERYRWMIERYSNDGGTTWSNWSTPVVADYLAEDGRSITVKGMALTHIAGSTLPSSISGSADDFLLNDSTTGTALLKHNGSTWATASVMENDAYITKDNGHLWIRTDDNTPGNRWTDCGQIKGDKGDDGDDAVTYSLQCSPSAVNFRSDATGSFPTSAITIAVKVMKTIGDVTTEVQISQSMYDGMYLTRRDNFTGSWRTTSSTIQVYASEALRETDPLSSIELSLQKTANKPLWSVAIPIVLDGRRGATGAAGKIFYPMGTYDPDATYTRTGDLIPLVFFDDGAGNYVNGARGHYYYLKANTNVSGSTHYAPADADGSGNTYPYSSTVWKLATDFGLVITQGIFAEFAKLGKAIMSGDYMLSMNGRIFDEEYNDGRQFLGKPAYTYFNGSDPNGEEAHETVGILNNTSIPNVTTSLTTLTDSVTMVKGKSYSFELAGRNTANGTTMTVYLYKGNARIDTIATFTSIISSTKTFDYECTASGIDYTIKAQTGTGTGTVSRIDMTFSPIRFVPNWWVDLLTGKMSAARGNFIVAPDGSVSMSNAIVSGSLMYKKTKYVDVTNESFGSNAITLYDGSDGKLFLTHDTVVLAGTYNAGKSFEIWLPLAKYCVGAEVVVKNVTSNWGSGIKASDISFHIYYDDYHNARDSVDYSGEIFYTNQFVLPFAIGTVFGNFTDFSAAGYKSITLIATECPKRGNKQQDTTYVWMVVDAVSE